MFLWVGHGKISLETPLATENNPFFGLVFSSFFKLFRVISTLFFRGYIPLLKSTTVIISNHQVTGKYVNGNF